MMERTSIIFQLAIIEGCQLPVKGRGGSSDPFVVVHFNGKKYRTAVVRRNLNPVWNAVFNFSVEASDFPFSMKLLCCSKDRIRKNYIGEVCLSTHHLVSGELPKTWERSEIEDLQLVNHKNKNENPGFIKIRYGFVTSEDDICDFVSWKPIWDAFAAQSFPVYTNLYRSKQESNGYLSSSTEDFSETMRELSEATTERLILGHEASDSGTLFEGSSSDSCSDSTPTGVDTKNPLLGVVFIDILSSSDLPYDKNLTRTSFDMDPFVVITHGRETFKTRFLRHTLNPIWNERLCFHIRRSYLNHVVKFSVYDHDKFSNNDFIGSYTVTVKELLSLQGQAADSQNTVMVEKTVPLVLAKDKWRESFKSNLTIRASLKTTDELRSALWMALIKQHDSDENGSINHFEILSLLEYLKTMAPEKLADQIFKECGKSPNVDELSFTELITVLESYTREEGSKASIECDDSLRSSELLEDLDLRNNTISHGEAYPRGQKMFYIDTCPICCKYDLSMLSDADIVTHVAICTMEDPEIRVERLMVGDFVTEAYAQRKWFARAVNRLGYGRYRVGRNNANIIVQNRATGQLMEEKIPAYIRLGIRLLYKNIASKSTVDTRAIRRLLKATSLKQGRKFNDPASISSIRPFIQFHQINTDEIRDPIESFKNFNEFFYRKLKPESRVLVAPNDPRVVVSPADCRCTCFPTTNNATRLWIKGEDFTIARLLGETSEENQVLAQIFEDGPLVICRLAPQDYHRFHFPVDGRVRSHQALDGQYFTVNPMAIRSGLDVYGENKRNVTIIESEQFGLVAFVSIGAMMVGSIELTCEPGQRYSRMDEFGYFAFGGSTIVLLFQQGMVKFDTDLVENSQRSLETLIQVGNSIGIRPDALRIS
ncbi:phosphatidylserine decarboxylase [Basidiobolus ranarum]|uniref:Phosphatidylserine decarboxylase proenzyme 2 n=1 Tax=Basidiobolus ranarum TaxID=34480 RepID=A0ABR2WN83_9FUNG